MSNYIPKVAVLRETQKHLNRRIQKAIDAQKAAAIMPSKQVLDVKETK